MTNNELFVKKVKDLLVQLVQVRKLKHRAEKAEKSLNGNYQHLCDFLSEKISYEESKIMAENITFTVYKAIFPEELGEIISENYETFEITNTGIYTDKPCLKRIVIFDSGMSSTEEYYNCDPLEYIPEKEICDLNITFGEFKYKNQHWPNRTLNIN